MLGRTFKVPSPYLHSCTYTAYVVAVMSFFLVCVSCFPTNTQQCTRDFFSKFFVMPFQILPDEHTSSILKLRLSDRLKKYFHDYLFRTGFPPNTVSAEKCSKYRPRRRLQIFDDVRNAVKGLCSLAF